MKLNPCRWATCLLCAAAAISSASAFALAPSSPGQTSNQPQTVAADSQTKSSTALTSYPIISIVPVDKNRKDKDWGYRYTEDGFFGKALTPRLLIQEAYNLYDDQRILGMPQWASSNSYDLSAKVEPAEVQQFKAMPDDQRRAMLRDLLETRFKLTAHYEKRSFSVYDLVIAKKGIKMQLSTYTVNRSMNTNPGLVLASRPGYLKEANCSLQSLTLDLTFAAGREVVDHTGLTGRYDFSLQWNPGLDAPSDHRDAGKAATAQGEDPSIFTAVQQQLGLQLKPARAPLDVLVIDHIAQPEAN